MSHEAVEKIREYAWRQGQVLSQSLHGHIAQLTGKPVVAGSVAVVVTQSCNLVHRDLQLEPSVEILIGEPVSVVNGNYMHGRSPRCLHLPLRVAGSEVHYQFLARDRVVVPREILATAPHDSERIVPETGLRTLIAWLAARYERTALPDEFQNRLRPIQEKLRKQAKKLTDVPDLFIALDPSEEADAETDYRVLLVFVMPADRFADSGCRGRVQTVAVEMARLLRSCNGVSLDDEPEVKADDEFTLADLKMLRRWGDFDYASFADQGAHETPTHGA